MLLFVFLLLAVSALPTHTNNATLIPIEENSGKMNYITIEWVNTTSLPAKLEGFSAAVVKHDSETPPRVKHWTISDCESFSREQMAAVIRYYPYVEVVCEKQNSLLYPSVLDDSPTGPKQPDATDWYLTKLTSYRFKEFKIEVEAEETFLKMPLAQCVAFSHEEAPATTEVRLTIAGSPKVTPGISGGMPIPYFGISSGFTAGLGVTASIYVNHACNGKTAPVRPFISLATIKLRICSRQWKVNFHRYNFIKKLEWEEDEFTLLGRRAPVLSCVSELYQPGVCGWTDFPMDDKPQLLPGVDEVYEIA